MAAILQLFFLSHLDLVNLHHGRSQVPYRWNEVSYRRIQLPYSRSQVPYRRNEVPHKKVTFLPSNFPDGSYKRILLEILCEINPNKHSR